MWAPVVRPLPAALLMPAGDRSRPGGGGTLPTVEMGRSDRSARAACVHFTWCPIRAQAVASDGDAKLRTAYVEYMLGLAASLGDVVLSGFVSIYFEKVLKSKTETYSVWDRNFQLSFWSILIYTPVMLYDNPTHPFIG